MADNTQVTIENTTTTPTTPQRPEHVPEKFWDAEKGTVKVDELAKGYGELEKKQSGKKEETTTTTTTPNPEQKPTGVDFTALAKEAASNGGKLKDETRAALKEQGADLSVVDTFLGGLKAKADSIVADITKAAGGADKLTDIYEWARANLTQEEISAYDSVLDAGNPEASKLAFAGLLSKYTAANGQDPNLVRAEGGSNTSGVKPFASQQEMVAAMKDPRYKNGDPAYHKEVQQRLAASQGLVHVGRPSL